MTAVRRWWGAPILAVAVLLALLPATAPAAAAPAPPTLAAPSDGAVVDGDGTRLAVDLPPGTPGPLDVEFRLRKAGATAPNPAADFTLVTVPDTQNYVLSAANRPTMQQQMSWIAQNADRLDTALVTHLGDLVSTTNDRTQWSYASQYLRILDDAAVPNVVLPGNHDMDVATGQAPLYREYFPVSRYAAAAWNSPAVRYGGYYGQNLFGPDASDRGAMNGFVLLRAGGMDLVVLTLEFNPPDDVLAWAGRVLAAYPDRRAILVTHPMIHVNGEFGTSVNRPGGNAGYDLWTELVSSHCSVDMVFSGHNSDGELAEAMRTERNDCGEKVPMVVSDYQSRAGGGNGWLRYYTFQPSQNRILAQTYSTKLGVFETDADSDFAIPYDMGVSPAGFETVGTASGAAGERVGVDVDGLEPATTYEWYATADDGTDSVSSVRWTFTTADVPEAGDFVVDAFDRSATRGWGPAGVGGTWSWRNVADWYSVAGGEAAVTAPPGATAGAYLRDSTAAGSDVTAVLRTSRTPNATMTTELVARRALDATYQARVGWTAQGRVTLSLGRTASMTSGVVTLATSPVSLPVAAGERVRVRVQAEGTSPTTVRAKVWKLGAAEPTGWQVTATDSTAGLQRRGSVGLTSYLSSSATNGPVTLYVDDVRATHLGTASPPPAPPTASFTTSGTGLWVVVDGTASTAAPGLGMGHSWDWGDGTPKGTGATATHAYASPGSYQVTLTVTDSLGRTATTTQAVQVVAAPAWLAYDDFDRTVASGWGAAPTGGAWSAATGLDVTAGAGRMTLGAGQTRTTALPAVSARDLDAEATVATGSVPNGRGAHVNYLARRTASGDYRTKLVLNASGTVTVSVGRLVTGTETLLATATLPGYTHAAGQRLTARTQVTTVGSATSLRAKVWPAGQPEPAAWLVTATDSQPELQGPGHVAVSAYVSSSVTNGPVLLSFDDLRVRAAG
jgi:PKD repeat protein